jgi:branched-subunit amino acid transport protein AzlD
MSISNLTVATPSSYRKISLLAGVFYLLTFVSIPSIALYTQVKGANYILGAGPDTAAIVGGILEVIVALAGIATAIVLFTVLKKQNEGLALGLVASRVLEAAAIFVGVASLLSIVSLRTGEAGADALIAGHTLVALYDRIFLLSQSFLPAVNDLLLGFLLYQSRLVPRALSMIGIVGGPILIAGFIAMMFGLVGRLDPLAGLSAIPVALFELSLGVWLIVKGFSPKAVAALEKKT